VKTGGDETLFEMVKLRYPDAYECVEKIAGLIASKYNYAVSTDERLYMMIHIENLTKSGENSPSSKCLGAKPSVGGR